MGYGHGAWKLPAIQSAGFLYDQEGTSEETAHLVLQTPPMHSVASQERLVHIDMPPEGKTAYLPERVLALAE